MGERPSKTESFAALFEREASHAPRRRSFLPGDEIDVTVVQIGRDAVFVELDDKQEGFIESKDLLSKSGELAVKVGSRITARVAEVGGRPGAVRLVPLLVRAPESDDAPAESVAIETSAGGALSIGAAVKGTVAAIERYGIFLELGAPAAKGSPKRPLRGLIPTSELGVPRGADLHRLMPLGTALDARVIAIDERGRIKLSVLALRAAAERHEFEVFEQQSRGSPGNSAPKGLGTLGDLLNRKK